MTTAALDRCARRASAEAELADARRALAAVTQERDELLAADGGRVHVAALVAVLRSVGGFLETAQQRALFDAEQWLKETAPRGEGETRQFFTGYGLAACFTSVFRLQLPTRCMSEGSGDELVRACPSRGVRRRRASCGGTPAPSGARVLLGVVVSAATFRARGSRLVAHPLPSSARRTVTLRWGGA